MILVDANLLLYAYDESSSFHAASRDWLEELFSQPQPVLLPWSTLLAFLRISTHRRVFEQPLSLEEASEIVSEWLELPQVIVPVPHVRHWRTLQSILLEGQAKGPLVSDAHLAALAVENGATLASSDRDFARFPSLRSFNPLTQA